MHVGAHVAFRNDAASAANKKLLVFGDSYVLHSRTSLTGMLAETATKVEFIWSSNLDWRYSSGHSRMWSSMNLPSGS
jgi:hypothetical protein